MVVWRLDRFGRALKDLVTKVEELEEKEVAFRSLQENIDSGTSGGNLQFQIFSALAEFERTLARERTMAGLRAARARGSVGGRPPIMDENKVQMASHLKKNTDQAVG